MLIIKCEALGNNSSSFEGISKSLEVANLDIIISVTKQTTGI